MLRGKGSDWSKEQNLPSSKRSRASCCSRGGFLSSFWQSHSKHSSSPTSLRDIAEVAPKPKHHPKELSLRELLAAFPEEALGPEPLGRTQGPGGGHGHAPAQLKWRVCTGPLAHRHPGGPGRRWLPEPGGGAQGVKHLSGSDRESPAQSWSGAGRRRGGGRGGSDRCAGVRGEGSRQVHGVRPAICIQILLPLFLPQKQWRTVISWEFHGATAKANTNLPQADTYTCLKLGLWQTRCPGDWLPNTLRRESFCGCASKGRQIWVWQQYDTVLNREGKDRLGF